MAWLSTAPTELTDGTMSRRQRRPRSRRWKRNGLLEEIRDSVKTAIAASA